MTEPAQDILFDASETGAKFAAYHARNPHIYERFKELVAALEREGARYITVALIFELIRLGAREKSGGGITFKEMAPYYTTVAQGNMMTSIDATITTTGDMFITTAGPEHIKLGNSYKPYYVRLFERDYPDRARLFRKRRAKADADS